jgi:cytochrome P450
MLLLLENPEAVARVRASPELIPRMTEEALRLEPPVLWQPRRVTRQTELAGVLLPEGATLLLLQGSANYDEATFTCPAGFDVERENVREHVTFGYGPHTCLGAPLARLELRIAFARLLGRLDDIRLAEDNDLRHIESPKIRGLRSLNIEYKRRSQA